MRTSQHEVTAALGQALAHRIGEPRYQLWFHKRTKLTLEADILTVGVPNRFYQEWLQKTFADDVAAAARDVLDQAVKVRFVIDPELFREARQAEAAAAPTLPAEKTAAAAESERLEPTPAATAKKTAARKQHARRWHNLDDFIVGPCNRVAHASALAVVENPGLEVNPLVLHGPVGTGKTHLLEGIYLGLRRGAMDGRVCFISAEDFTNRFTQALRLGKLSAFRKYFRDCDALLLDDLHFLATKRATQEEFLHTFDVLHANGRQIAVTCDCHPRLNEQFLPELVDRLLGGAVWGVLPPDYDTRLNLLRAKSPRNGTAPLPEDVLLFLADHLRGNVRELEGALNSLFHYSRVADRKIDIPLTREALGELLRHSVRVVQLPEVDQSVCAALQMDHGSLQTKNRSWAYSHPRMLAMYLARKYTRATYTEIGRYFGNRSHSTVVAAEKKVRAWLHEDGSLHLGHRQLRVRDVLEKAERMLLG